MTKAYDCSKVSGDQTALRSVVIRAALRSVVIRIMLRSVVITIALRSVVITIALHPTCFKMGCGELGMAQSGWGQWSSMVDRSVTSSWETSIADELSSVA